MGDRHPAEADRKRVFSEAQHPIAERLRARVYRSSRGRLRSMRGQGNSSREQSCSDPPFLWNARKRAVGKHGGGRGPDEGMNDVPNIVDVRNLVGDELD